MEMLIPTNRRELKDCLKEPIFKNSFFLFSSRILTAGGGLFFWMIAARLYSIENIGIATALYSSLNLVGLFSRLGFDFSLIRFISFYDKKTIFSTCLIVTTITSVLIGFSYTSIINILTPRLSLFHSYDNNLIFIISAIVLSAALIIGNTFIAIGKPEYYFLQNLLLVLRIPLLVPLVTFEYLGIFGSIGLANIIVVFLGLFYISTIIRIEPKINTSFIRESFVFSSCNYISNVISSVPSFILPILILNSLGETEAAKYYIAFAIGNIVLMIPDAVSYSLFAEGSQGGNLRENAIKAGTITFIFLVIAVIFIYLFGGILLGLFGKSYIEAIMLLKVLSLSSFFVSLYSLFMAIQNIRMRVKSIIKFNLVYSLLLLSLSYLLMLNFGIIGVGYAWLITYVLLCFWIIASEKNKVGFVIYDIVHYITYKL